MHELSSVESEVNSLEITCGLTVVLETTLESYPPRRFVLSSLVESRQSAARNVCSKGTGPSYLFSSGAPSAREMTGEEILGAVRGAIVRPTWNTPCDAAVNEEAGDGERIDEGRVRSPHMGDS